MGLIAIGHSGLNGHGTVPGVAISWATGTATGVNSVYQRLVAVLPETEGHVENMAVSGSRASALVSQARAALATVAAPALVIIQTIDNDILCTEDEAPYIAEFGTAFASALAMIAEASPQSTILVVSSFGRPAGYAAMLADYPDIRKAVGGSGSCDMFDGMGTLVPERLERLTDLVGRYEAEAARVCRAVPQCRTDDGIFTDYVEELDEFVSDDWGHLNSKGQARLAELIWPKVVEILDLE